MARYPPIKRLDRRLIPLIGLRPSDEISTGEAYTTGTVTTGGLLGYLKQLLDSVPEIADDPVKVKSVMVQLEICKEMRRLVQQKTREMQLPPPPQLTADETMEELGKQLTGDTIRKLRAVMVPPINESDEPE